MENKTGRYFKYAIGEIILVVIGILIALQINNWNEQKKANEDSRTFMYRLSDEINQNIKSTEIEIEKEEWQVKSSKTLLEMFLEPIEVSTSRKMDSLIFEMLGSNTIDIKLGTLSEGLNTGKVSLISSDSLKRQLYSFPALVDDTKKMEALESNDINDNLIPYLYEKINFKKMDRSFSENKEELGISKFDGNQNLELLNSIKFENIMDNRFYNTNQSLRQYRRLLNELRLIENLVSKNLKDD